MKKIVAAEVVAVEVRATQAVAVAVVYQHNQEQNVHHYKKEIELECILQ